MTGNPVDESKRSERSEKRASRISLRSHSQTIRQQIIGLLVERELSAREISQISGVREKEVYEHLPHVARSATAAGKKLLVLPFRCFDCGFVFEERKRFTRPSRCPRCKKSHLETPIYHLS